MSRMEDASGDTPKIRFEITESRPEDEPNVLAIKMAECLNTAALAQQDGETYKTAAGAELQKARQLQDVIFQIKEREKNPPAKVSRMDPLSHYDLEDCEKQLKVFKDRAVELQAKSDEFLQKANENRNEANKLQIRIREANKKARG